MTEITDETKKQYSQNYQKQSEDKIYPIESFPPCIVLGLNGLKDGRKRFMFILRNFLSSSGWGKEEIKLTFENWNKKNLEPLRQSEIEIQTKYITKKVLPPNCDRKEYYDALLICKPDGLCKMIKNPVSYAKRKTLMLEKEKIEKEKEQKKKEKEILKEEKLKKKLEKEKKKKESEIISD
jgi:hypothetical protein